MIVPPFDVKVLGADGRHRIVLSGELDVASAPRLVASVRELISTRPRELEIDLRQVTFIDSAGLRTLIVARDESIAAGVSLYLIPCESPLVRNVFAITSAEDQLPWRAPVTEVQRTTIERLEEAYHAHDEPEREAER